MTTQPLLCQLILCEDLDVVISHFIIALIVAEAKHLSRACRTGVRVILKIQTGLQEFDARHF